MGYRLINHLGDVGRTLEEFVNHSPAAGGLQIFSCSTNIPRGLSAYKRQKLVVYCLIIPYLHDSHINAHALIGQSAIGYCAGKPMEKSCIF